jgi:hypothetical protein
MSLAADQWLGAPPPKLSKGGKYRLSGRRFSVALQESPPSSQMDNYNIFRSSCSSDTSSPGSQQGSFALKTSDSRSSTGGSSDASPPGSQPGSFALKTSGSRLRGSSSGSSSSSGDGGNGVESPGSGGSDEAVSSGASSPGSSPRLAPAVELMPPPPPPYTFHSTAARRRATELYPLIEVSETAAGGPRVTDGTTARATPPVGTAPGFSDLGDTQVDRSSYSGKGVSERCTTDLCPTDLIQHPVPVTLEDKLAISERIQAAMENELTVCRESLARVQASVGSVGLMDVGELKLRVVFATVAAVQAAQNNSHFHAAGLLYAGGPGERGGAGGGAAGWAPAVRNAIAGMDALRKATSTCAFTAGCSLLRLLAIQAREYRAVLNSATSSRALQDAASGRALQDAAEYNLRSITATVADVAHNTRVAAWAVDGSSASVSQLERECAAQRSAPLQLAAARVTRMYASLLSGFGAWSR